MILALSSLVVLVLLVVHSWRTMARARAVAFWCGVVAYGLLRGVALRWAIALLPGASFPYAIRQPLFPVLGVPFQEIAGWAIVGYLGWWLGGRFSRQLFSQVAWACVFLGAVSWTVESAAVAAGWWSWAVPVTQPLFLNVPFIAIVDWLFVGIDFLLPLAALTAPGLRGRPVRWLALLLFPFHFAAHGFADRTLGGVPIPIHHLVHWILIATLLWLALRATTVDEPFADRDAWLPLAGLGVVLFVVAAVDLLLVRRPALLVATVPTLAASLQPFLPAAGYAVGGLALLLALHHAPWVVGAGPAATAAILRWGRRRRPWVAWAAVGIVA
ncbi:MAG TPA: hypothetical protein VJS92_00050, partial [Candidatus Polarisedimenticolaceae bacterium]|nr:hypothetical protein [Candidatus Polarisedimenticolaceae bacterium]